MATTAVPSVAPSSEVTSEQQLLDHFSATTAGDDVERVRAFEEAVARCMMTAGFEYVPVIPADLDSGPGPVRGEDWYAAWGYGISIDMSEAEETATSTDPPDPNAEYLASLTDDGRRAYEDALEGTLEPGEQPRGEPGELGCLGEASDDVAPSAVQPEPIALVQQLQEQISLAVPARVSTDVRTRDAVDELVSCVVAAGGREFDPLSGESAYDQVAQAYEDLMADGEPSQTELLAFQEWERSISTAEHRCSEPLVDAVEMVRDDVVREIVGPHRAELEALVEQMATG